MEHHSSLLPAGPEWNAFVNQLRQRARRQLLSSYSSFLHRDALESAVTDGLLIFWRKLAESDLSVEHPEAFAFEIVKRTFWDYRRRARSAHLPEDAQFWIKQQWSDRKRFPDGDALFTHLHEPHLWHWYQRLSCRDRQLLDLRCQGYLDKEIAAQVGLSYGWVRNRFSFLLGAARAIAQRA